MKNIKIISAKQIGKYLNEVHVQDLDSGNQYYIKAFPKAFSERSAYQISRDLKTLEGISHYHFNNFRLLHNESFDEDFKLQYGVPISAEDYFEGEDFNHWKDHLKNEAEGIVEILRYCKDLACILDEIHSENIRHCFVDLESILISPDKGLRLTHITNRIYERYLDPNLAIFETKQDALACEKDYFGQIIEYFIDEFLTNYPEGSAYKNKAASLVRVFKEQNQSFSVFVGHLLKLFGYDYMEQRNKAARALRDFLVNNEITHKDLQLCSHSVAETRQRNEELTQ